MQNLKILYNDFNLVLLKQDIILKNNFIHSIDILSGNWLMEVQNV